MTDSDDLPDNAAFRELFEAFDTRQQKDKLNSARLEIQVLLSF